MDSIYNLSNQLVNYFTTTNNNQDLNTREKLNSDTSFENLNCMKNPFNSSNFGISQPFPYSYFAETLNYGITGPFQLSSGTIYATRINRQVTLSFNEISITGNNTSNYISFPLLPSAYTPATTNTNSFPIDVIQAGNITPGRLYISGSNMLIGVGNNCIPFTGSNLNQGYLSFNITFIDSIFS